MSDRVIFCTPQTELTPVLVPCLYVVRTDIFNLFKKLFGRTDTVK